MLFVWGTGKLSRQAEGHEGWLVKEARRLKSGPGVNDRGSDAGEVQAVRDRDATAIDHARPAAPGPAKA